MTDDGGGGSGNSTDDGCNKLSDLQVWSLTHSVNALLFLKYYRFYEKWVAKILLRQGDIVFVVFQVFHLYYI